MPSEDAVCTSVDTLAGILQTIGGWETVLFLQSYFACFNMVAEMLRKLAEIYRIRLT